VISLGVLDVTTIAVAWTAGATPPLMFGGVLVGVLLLILFLGILLRTFRTMQAASEQPRIELARQAADELVDRWQQAHDRDTLRLLIDDLRLAEDAGEAEIFAAALSRITDRYFGTDGIAWEVWYRRESERFVNAAATGDEFGAMSSSEIIRVS
jgi:hypothetical protein